MKTVEEAAGRGDRGAVVTQETFPPRAIRRDSEKTGRLKWAQDGRCGGLRSEGNDGSVVGQIPPNKGKRRKGGRKFTVFDWTGLLYKREGEST